MCTHTHAHTQTQTQTQTQTHIHTSPDPSLSMSLTSLCNSSSFKFVPNVPSSSPTFIMMIIIIIIPFIFNIIFFYVSSVSRFLYFFKKNWKKRTGREPLRHRAPLSRQCQKIERALSTPRKPWPPPHLSVERPFVMIAQSPSDQWKPRQRPVVGSIYIALVFFLFIGTITGVPGPMSGSPGSGM